MKEATEKLLKEIKECDSLHNNCDYLLEHSDCDLLIEYVEQLEKTVCDFSLDNVKLNDYQLILSRENTQLKERVDKADKDIQKLLDDINTKTIIGLNSFIPRLEVIQDELVGGNNE